MDIQESIVFVVDDDAAVRNSIKWLVESVGLTARACASGSEFLRNCDSRQPGCLVTDMRMPEMSGLELQDRLLAQGINMPVILMTAYGDVPTAVRAMKKGAVDFVEKPFNEQAMLDLINKCLNSDVERRKVEDECQEILARFQSLSIREQDVLRLIVDGNSNKQVARLLNIAPKTVETHRAQVMEKMAAPTFADLVRLTQTCI